MSDRRSYRISLPRLFKTWVFNLYFIAKLVLSWGGKAGHEGRFRRGEWVDWAGVFRCRPSRFERPETEADLCRIVREAKKVRVVGAGHSFNAAPLCDESLVSLDAFQSLELLPHPSKPDWRIAVVGAGIRLRDFNHKLRVAGYALSVAGSTDAQSIGGLLATDLHGTGRDHGFLSELVVMVRIVDADGIAKTFRRGDDTFHAAIGGFGTCGVVIAAEIECEPAYNLAKAVKLVDRNWAEENIEALLKENTHLSFYYLAGFARTIEQEDRKGVCVVRMNKWNRTLDPPNRFLRMHKLFDELLEALFSGFLFDFARLFFLATPLAKLSLLFYEFCVNQRELVYPFHRAFARTLFFRHDEIEYALPIEHYSACLRQVRELLIRRRFPTIVEVRFTPDASQGLMGPGAGRPSVYVELAPSLSRPTDPLFREFEQIVRAFGGRPHVGKKVYFSGDSVQTFYAPELIDRFRRVRQVQDPSGKFWNAYAERHFKMQNHLNNAPNTEVA